MNVWLVTLYFPKIVTAGKRWVKVLFSFTKRNCFIKCLHLFMGVFPHTWIMTPQSPDRETSLSPFHSPKENQSTKLCHRSIFTQLFISFNLKQFTHVPTMNSHLNDVEMKARSGNPTHARDKRQLSRQFRSLRFFIMDSTPNVIVAYRVCWVTLRIWNVYTR